MKEWNIGNSNLYIPLSYNVQNENYRLAVISGFKDVFGEKAHFLLDFESYDVYIKRFLTFKIAIFSTWRQEALGNIEICFQIGIKVLLSRNNPYLAYFQGLGLRVYALEDVQTPADLEPLNENDKKYNRETFYRIIEERKIKSNNDLRTYFSKYV